MQERRRDKGRERIMTSRLASLVIAALLVLPAPVQAQKDNRAWYQAYSDGVRAIGQRAWQAAVDSLLVARRAGPRPGRHIPSYGDNTIDFYSPDYYLGIAYLNLQRFADAETAFEQVRQAGLVQAKDKEFAAFNASASRATFERLMADAETKLSSGDFAAAQQAASRAETLYVDKGRTDRLRSRITKAELDAAEAKKKAAATIDPAKPPDPKPPDPKPPDPNPTDPVVPPVQNPAVQYNPPGTGTVSTTPTKPADSPRAKFPPRGGGVPTDLAGLSERAAMERFFSGEYSAAAEILTNLLNSNAATPASYFYLACSKAALVLMGQADRAALDEARQLFAQAGGSSQLSEHRKYISPRILQVLEGKQ